MLHAMLNLLVMMVIKPCFRPSLVSIPWSMDTICNYEFLRSLSSLGMVGVPPHQSHPQVPSFTQTGMPKHDLFSEPLLWIVTFQEMKIKHFIYMQKVPFLYTERACAVFFSFEIHPGRLRTMTLIG